MNLFLKLCRDGNICVGIVAKYKQLFITECSGICVNLRMIWNQYVIHTVHHNFVCMAKCNQLFIISKNRIWIVYLFGCVDCFVVFIYLQPWCARCKAAIVRCVPLHWCTCIVTSNCLDIAHNCFGQDIFFCCQLFVSIETFNITIICDIFHVGICHAQLLTLIYVWRTLLEMSHSCKHLG